ncbi:hypothetical protein DEF23_22995 [Marinitenerispora sediminis]|nr:hypothetical protein DEF23_22995 [Marinitenerispora sediminis]
MLNLHSRGPRHRADAERELAAFSTDGGPGGLLARGWAREEPPDGRVRLTARGRAVQATAARVAEDGERAVRGPAPRRHTGTVEVLAAVAGNVRAALAER